MKINKNYFPITFISEGNNKNLETQLFKLFKKSNINTSFEKIKAGYEFFEKGIMTGCESNFFSKIKLNKIIILDKILNIYRKGYENLNQEIMNELRLYIKKIEFYDENISLKKTFYEFFDSNFSIENKISDNIYKSSKILNKAEISDFFYYVFNNHKNSNFKIIIPNNINYFFKNSIIDELLKYQTLEIDLIETQFFSREILNEESIFIFFSESDFIKNHFSNENNFQTITTFLNQEYCLFILPNQLDNNSKNFNIDYSLTLFVSKILEFIGHEEQSKYLLQNILSIGINKIKIDSITDHTSTEIENENINKKFIKKLKDNFFSRETKNEDKTEENNELIKEIEITFLSKKTLTLKDIMVDFFDKKISINKINHNGKMEFINESIMKEYEKKIHIIRFLLDENSKMPDILEIISENYKILNIFFIYI